MPSATTPPLRDRCGQSWYVRDLRPEDGPVLAAYFAAMSARDYANFHPHPLDEPTAEGLADEAADPGAVRCVLFGDAACARDAAGYGFLLDWEDDEPLLGMSIAPSVRGRGLGSAFTRYLVERAAAARKAGVRLTVYRDNVPAFRSYVGAGFRETGAWADDWGGEVREEVGMRCALGARP